MNMRSMRHEGHRYGVDFVEEQDAGALPSAPRRHAMRRSRAADIVLTGLPKE
jgi:hypothetical protein